MIFTRTINVATTKNKQAVDITADVDRAVLDSGITEGLALVFTTHTTTGLFLNERENGLLGDVERVLCDVVPVPGDYAHDRVDDNAASHIQSILLGSSLVIPVGEGRLSLGTWQAIVLAERDGPRRRSVIVKVVGDRM